MSQTLDMTLQRKTEKMVAWFLRKRLTDFALVVEGQDVQPPKHPLAVIYAYGESEHDGMPTDTGVRLVLLRVFLEWDDRESLLAARDAMASAVVSLMEDLPAIQQACNQPYGADPRPVQGFHIYDVAISNKAADRQDKKIQLELEYTITCAEHNCVLPGD